MRRLPLTASMLALLTIGVFGLAACDDDGFSPGAPLRDEVAVVVNSIDVSVTVFPVDTPSGTRNIGLGPAGSPVTVAARNNLVVVPLGFFPAVAVLDLETDDVTTIALPANSGATGAAFLNDSIAYIANPNLNSVSRINVLSGSAEAEIDVNVFPQAIAVSEERIYVMTAQLDATFQPAREGRISVIEGSSDTVIDTIVLSGLNPSAAAFGPDGLLYVVNSGNFGLGNGSLSVVDVTALSEVEHHQGFGEFPGDIAFGADGNAYVTAFAYGVAIWDAAADSFIRSPANALVIDGNTSASGLGFDSDGRLYTLVPGDCVAPSSALRSDQSLTFDTEIAVGVCPFGIAFGEIER